MGVTSEHPLFVAGDGWTRAGDVAAGDAIRDKDLRALTVLAVKVDNTPTRVHNLEVADAHTYFAGELEAWGHDSFWQPTPVNVHNNAVRNNDGRCGCGCGLSLAPSTDKGVNGATREHRIPQAALKVLGVPKSIRDSRPNIAPNAWRRLCNLKGQARGKNGRRGQELSVDF